jgi:hypothetical protein
MLVSHMTTAMPTPCTESLLPSEISPRWRHVPDTCVYWSGMTISQSVTPTHNISLSL